MASQGVTASDSANSRLSQMQMRFQQKQQQEREQRRLELTEEAGVVTENVAGVKPVSNGKVRQMFDERRRGAGIDRANPLKPIIAPKPKTQVTVRGGSPTMMVARSTLKSRSTVKSSNGNVSPITPTAALKRNPIKRIQNGNNNDTIVKEMSSLSLGVGAMRNDRNNNNNDVTDSTLSRGQSSSSLKLKPVLTKKSPPPVLSNKRQTYASPTSRQTMPSRVGPKATPSTVKTPSRKQSTMSSSTMGLRQQSSSHEPPPPGVGVCRFCNRHFNLERLGKHEKVCEKMVHTKRKIFDAARHRLRGTDAEKYLKKSQSRSSAVKQSYTSAAAVTGLSAGLKKNNWRKKHEEFINAIRAAKQVQAHLARGGKLSELPPPPPSENPDYIQCPHCLRRFNESAAERHIPRCANMLHNKPKPGQQPARKR